MRCISIFLLLVGTMLIVPSAAASQGGQNRTPEALLDSWIRLWASYDLDDVDDLFLESGDLTYFSSEFEGLIQGFDAIVEHHEGFGFVPGGADRDALIWVDEVKVVDFGDTALIAAIWYFGDPTSPEDAQRGPMSVLAVPTEDGYRIGHMNFATYPEG